VLSDAAVRGLLALLAAKTPLQFDMQNAEAALTVGIFVTSDETHVTFRQY